MRSLLLLEFSLEVRRKSVITSLFLYLICLAFISYFSLGAQASLSGQPWTWCALFWIAILSTEVNVISKSFIVEKSNSIYLYSLANPADIILSRILYGVLISFVMALSGFVLFSVLLSNPIEDTFYFFLTLALSSFGFSATLTLLSAIASKTNNGNVIMAILSFPVTIGILLLSIKVTKNCIDGLDRNASFDELLILGAINVLVTAVSYLLFPYIWRS